MTKPVIYGIKNCDTMKKTFQWFEDNGVEYIFHDYKKQGADEKILAKAIAAQGWEEVLNRKGTTWRQLPEKTREGMNAARALKTAAANPSVIRRPLIVQGGKILLGFDAAVLASTFLRR